MKERIRDGKALVRIGSHRARHKLQSLLGRRPQTYFKYTASGEWAEVTPAELELIQANPIKGITRSAWDDELRGHWMMVQST